MRTAIVVALFAVLAFDSANASTVEWDVFEHERFFTDRQYDSIRYYGAQITPEIVFSIEESASGIWTLVADGPINLGNSRALWVVAAADDILTQQYFSSAPVVLDSVYSDCYYFKTCVSIDMSYGDDAFLALTGNFYKKIFNDGTGQDEFIYQPYTAWISIAMNDGDFILNGSALSYDYGLQVGGGLMPTPEPSSLHLLIVGLACFSLRRRRMRQSPVKTLVKDQ